MSDSSLPFALRTRLASFVAELVQRVPGVLESIIVTGSALVGDWWEGVSDIDLILIIRRALTSAEVDSLTQLHLSTIVDGPIDGIYLTAHQLAAGPDSVQDAPQVVGGKLENHARGAQLTWITWREAERRVEGVIGSAGSLSWTQSLRMLPDAEAGARAFSQQNLQDYWKRFGAQARTQLSAHSDEDPVDAKTIRWIALGPARLIATIETGEIVSKTKAAALAAQRWPAHSELLARAVSSRQGESVSFSASDAREALDLLDRCVAFAQPEAV
jgi:hypothetical protein